MSHLPDALTVILENIKLKVDTYFFQAVGDPWYVAIQYRPQGIFHVVLEGECYLRESTQQTIVLLRTGDIVAFPTGGAHWLSSSAESQMLVAENVIRTGHAGEVFLFKTGNVSAFSKESAHWRESNVSDETVQKTTLLSCTFSYDTSIHHPFLKDLPCLITIETNDDPKLASLKALVRVLEEEFKRRSFGSSVIINRLTEVIFVNLLRVHINQQERSTGYMAALSDPKIGSALNSIHAETDERWTVGSLATAVGLSRTLFTERFRELVGMTPKSYLTRIRMDHARKRLQSDDDSMWSIAERAGYSSEASFSKAFKKYFNLTPGQVRRATPDKST